MVVFETLAIGGIIYGIHKNRRYKKMKRLAQLNEASLVPDTTTTTVTHTTYMSPGSSLPPVPTKTTTTVPTTSNTLNTSTLTVPSISPSTSPRSPSSFDDIHLISITVKDELGRVAHTSHSGTLTYSEGGYQALQISGGALNQSNLREGKQYFIDGTSNRGQKYTMAFFYYGVFDGNHFFSAVSPIQAQALTQSQPQQTTTTYTNAYPPNTQYNQSSTSYGTQGHSHYVQPTQNLGGANYPSYGAYPPQQQGYTTRKY